jgi:hypothetical protein
MLDIKTSAGVLFSVSLICGPTAAADDLRTASAAVDYKLPADADFG